MNAPTVQLSGVADIGAIIALARHTKVFPCKRDKTPLTEHGFKDASQDEVQIQVWWDQHPDALVGVPTGQAAGLIAIDYDPAKRTEATDEWISAHTDALLSARVHSTLRGGKHYLFRTNGTKYKSGADLTLAGAKRPGIDLRAEGGYIVWWPLHGGATAGAQIAPPLPAGIIDDRAVKPRASSIGGRAEKWTTTAPKLYGALAYIDPTPRDTWRDVGMAIHLATKGSDDGFALWAAWSGGELAGQSIASFTGEQDCRQQWDSYRHETENPVTLGSVFHLAKQAGFVMPGAKPAQAVSPPGPTLTVDEDGRPEIIPGTDMANTARFVERHGENIRCTIERGWMVWSGDRWQVDSKGMAVAKLAMLSADSMMDEIRGASDQKAAFAIARAAMQKRAIEAVIWMARSHCPENLMKFDANHMLFNAHNGIIDLATGQLQPHSRDAYCSLMGGCDFDPDAQCPRWLAFLAEITLGNPDLTLYLQRAAGYLLTGETSEQCLFFMHGGGSNGKTTFVETIMRVMGDYALTAEPDLIMSKRIAGIPNDVARLRGLRACFMNETKQGHSFDEPKLKNLTGGDTLSARFLREEFFDFKPTHKLILRGNHKPTVNGTDEGIWRRLHLIPFDLRLTDEQKDQKLLPALGRELPGILAWMVRGCLDWQASGLKTPEIVRAAVKEYRDESDTLGRFIEERCTQRANAQIKTGDLHKAYREFCEQSAERYLSAKDFPSEMEHRGFKRKKSNGQRLVLGIELKQSDSFGARYIPGGAEPDEAF